MDTERKHDRDAFVDAVVWLEARGALRTADGSATAWVGNPDKAEALYDIDRQIAAAVYQPSRVLQHLRSVTDLLSAGSTPGLARGRETQRRATAQHARRLVLEHPAVYYADVEESLHGQLRAPALAEDLERLTGLALERRAEGVALIDTSGRLSDARFPPAARWRKRHCCLPRKSPSRWGREASSVLPGPTPPSAVRARPPVSTVRLPTRGVFHAVFESLDDPSEDADGVSFLENAVDPGHVPAETAYPFLPETWLRATMRRLVAAFGTGMSSDLREDPDRLTAQAVDLLAAFRLVQKVEGGLLALPLLGRYRSVTAQVKTRAPAIPWPAQPPLIASTLEDIHL